jgi:chromosome segregation ATPase
MDTFKKIRSGISELKREKAELETRYNFLADELNRLVQANTKEIKDIAARTASSSESIAAVGEKIKKIDESFKGFEKQLGNEFISLRNKSEDFSEALIEIGNRMRDIKNSTDEANRGVRGSRVQDKELLKHMDSMQKRIGGLEALRERITEIEKAGDVILKGVQDLEKLRGSVASADERIGALRTLLEERTSALDKKILSGISGAKRDSDQHYSAVKKLGGDIEKINLDLTAIRKDMEAEKAGIARVRAGEAATRKRLEMIGTLQGKIKNLEDIKTGLLKGVESLKGIENKMAAIEQKTKDVDARLTTADKNIEAKVIEKTKLLDRQIAEKTAAMESQMQERLKFLDGSLTQKGRMIETKLEEIKPAAKQISALKKDMEASRLAMENSNKVLEGKLDYNITSIKKETAFSAASLARLDEEVKKLSFDMQSVKKDWQSASKDMIEEKTAMSRTQRKLADMEKLQLRLKDLEQYKEALSSSMDARLEEKMKFLETTLRQRGGNIEAGMLDKTRGIEAKLNSEIALVKKELAARAKSIEGVKNRLTAVGRIEERLKSMDEDKDVIAKSVASLQTLQTAQVQMEQNERNLEKEVREIKSGLSKNLTEIRGQLDQTKTGDRSKFDSAVKAFLSTRGELNTKTAGLDIKLSEMERRLNDFSRALIRIDTLEKKIDRLSERSTDMKRDMEVLGRKGGSEEKVMVVDLDRDVEEG